MIFAGEWHLFPDGIVRPALEIKVRGSDQQLYDSHFLVDTGADRSVLDANFSQKLNLKSIPPQSGRTLSGIGGVSSFAFVDAELILTSRDGHLFVAQFRFAALLNRAASDHSILGRDILDLFHVIVSRPRDEVLLLSGIHDYDIRSP